MRKIVLLPLDERPCNYDFAYKLFQSDDLKIVRPKELGDKKTAADIQKVKEFLLEEHKIKIENDTDKKRSRVK